MARTDATAIHGFEAAGERAQAHGNWRQAPYHQHRALPHMSYRIALYASTASARFSAYKVCCGTCVRYKTLQEDSGLVATFKERPFLVRKKTWDALVQK